MVAADFSVVEKAMVTLPEYIIAPVRRARALRKEEHRSDLSRIAIDIKTNRIAELRPASHSITSCV
jgi:hypothetical protein